MTLLQMSMWFAAATLACLATAFTPDCDDASCDTQFLQRSLQLQESKMATEAARQGARTAKAKRAGEIESHYFYVNFHGVDPNLATLLNIMHGAPLHCSTCGMHLLSCEEEGLTAEDCALRELEPCLIPAWSCSKDSGLKVFEVAIPGKDFKEVNSSDLSSLKNLWPDRKRYETLMSSGLANSWLPPAWGPGKRVLITTILRDPMERLRSVFYSLNPDHSADQFKYYLGNLSNFTKAMKQTPLLLPGIPLVNQVKAVEGCCEYSYYLGIDDVAKAKRLLASHFDFVGIFEDLPGSLVSLAWLFGKSPEGMGTLARDVGLQANTKTEKWDKADLELATNITAKDQQVYNFGKELFHRQSVSMWNNEEVLKEQAKKLEDAWNTKWEPE